MIDIENDEGPDPEVGMWGWEKEDKIVHVAPSKKKENNKPKTLFFETADYQFNRYLIDLYNEKQKNNE